MAHQGFPWVSRSFAGLLRPSHRSFAPGIMPVALWKKPRFAIVAAFGLLRRLNWPGQILRPTTFLHNVSGRRTSLETISTRRLRAPVRLRYVVRKRPQEFGQRTVDPLGTSAVSLGKPAEKTVRYPSPFRPPPHQSPRTTIHASQFSHHPTRSRRHPFRSLVPRPLRPADRWCQLRQGLRHL